MSLNPIPVPFLKYCIGNRGTIFLNILLNVTWFNKIWCEVKRYFLSNKNFHLWAYQDAWTINIYQAQNFDRLLSNLVESPGPVYPRLQPVSDVAMFTFEGRWKTVWRYFEAKLEGMMARRKRGRLISLFICCRSRGKRHFFYSIVFYCPLESLVVYTTNQTKN